MPENSNFKTLRGKEHEKEEAGKRRNPGEGNGLKTYQRKNLGRESDQLC